MAINFARCHYIQRSRGHSVLMAAAYIARARLEAPYPVVDYSDRGDLLFSLCTVLPPGAPARFENPWPLWAAAEQAAPRKDASLGLHLILALPAPRELAAELCIELVESFVRSTIMPHGLAVSYALHEAHPQKTKAADDFDWLEADSAKRSDSTPLTRRNRHAHILISGRRITAAGFEHLRYTALDPRHTHAGGASGGIAWPELWTRHQNAFFAQQGLGLRVRPQAKYADVHYGPGPAARARRIRYGEMVERANKAAVLNPTDLLALVASRPFTEKDLRELVDRYTPRQHPYDADAADEVLALPDVIRLAYPASGTGSPWYASLAHARAEQSCVVLAAAMMERAFPRPLLNRYPRATPTGSLMIIDEAEVSQTDLAGAVGLIGETAVAALHGWPTTSAAAFKVDISRPHYSLPNESMVVLDHADALPAAELQRLLQSALSTDDVALALIRRRNSLIYQRSSLLGLIAAMLRHDDATQRHEDGEEPSAKQIIDELVRTRRLVFTSRANLPETAAQVFSEQKAAGNSPAVICPDYELSALLRFNGLPVRPIAPPAGAVLIHCEPSFGNLSLLGLLSSTKNPVLIVDSGYCPDLRTLHEQIVLASSVPCAIAVPRHGFAAPRAPKSDTATDMTVVASRPGIVWAVDENGVATDSFDHIVASLRSTMIAAISDPDAIVARIVKALELTSDSEDGAVRAPDAHYIAESPDDLAADHLDYGDGDPDLEADDPLEDHHDVAVDQELGSDFDYDGAWDRWEENERD